MIGQWIGFDQWWIQILRFHVRVLRQALGHASICGSDASGPSSQISFNLGPSKVGGLGPLLSSKSLAFATLRTVAGDTGLQVQCMIRPDCKLLAMQYCRVVQGLNNTVMITLILHS